MKYSVIASALVVALFTSTVTTRAEGPVAATVAAPQEPLVARTVNPNTQAVNVIQQPGASSSGPQMASKKKVLIWVAILGAVGFMMLALKNQ
jgi:hypothetical protein